MQNAELPIIFVQSLIKTGMAFEAYLVALIMEMGARSAEFIVVTNPWKKHVFCSVQSSQLTCQPVKG